METKLDRQLLKNIQARTLGNYEDSLLEALGIRMLAGNGVDKTLCDMQVYILGFEWGSRKISDRKLICDQLEILAGVASVRAREYRPEE